MKPTKNPQKTIKNSQETVQKSTKNPQENQKVISFRKNIKIIVDTATRKGGIQLLGHCQILFLF
jgi:hypothetical protein